MSAAAPAPSDSDGLVGFVLRAIDQLGEFGVGVLILLETLVPPIPSEVVLPAAGALVYFGELSGWLTLLCATLGSVIGALILYGAGRAFGEERTRRVMLAVPLIEVDDVDRADEWFRRRGEWAVFIGRLIPGVRSLVSLPAGAAGMPVGRFVLLTTAGSTIWNGALILAGWLLGTQYHVVEDHIDLVNNLIYVTIGVSVGVFVMRRLAHRRRGARAGRDTPDSDLEGPPAPLDR